jgi:Aldehyde dehydrogenase family
MGFIGSAKSEGARLVTGGEPAREGELAKGLFVNPTIFADVRNDMRLAQDEVFGHKPSFECEDKLLHDVILGCLDVVYDARRSLNRTELEPVRDKPTPRTRKKRGRPGKAGRCSSRQGPHPWCELRRRAS